MQKKIPFDYKHFKANPDTKLEYRNGDAAYFIGFNPMKIGTTYELLTSRDNGDTTMHWATGEYGVGKNEDYKDLLMLVEVPEPIVMVAFGNVYEDCSNLCHNTLEEANRHRQLGAISVAKIVIVDGVIDLTQCETVHKY